MRKFLSGNFCFNFKMEDKATGWKIQTVHLTVNGEISWLKKFRTPRQGLRTNLRLMRASLVAQMGKNLLQCRRPSWIPGLGKSPGEGNGSPLHYACLENSMDRGARRATVHGDSKLGTTEWLIYFLLRFVMMNLWWDQSILLRDFPWYC